MINVSNIVDKYKELILKAERDLWAMPETGYFETKTNAYMIEAFEKMGYTLTKNQDITGFSTVIDTGKDGPTLLILAELDALICATHPECNKETGAVHVCGHNAQCAALLGVASALTHKEVLDGLCGKIKLCVVPAEEGIEIGKRTELIKKGIIHFTSGKPEMIRRGFLDDVDIAFMVHVSPRQQENPNLKFGFVDGHNGVVRKKTTFIGKAAHAGAHPHLGINALNTASTAITTINSLRETFKESEKVRIHSILTKAGDAVNAVPDTVVMESYVRSSSVQALKNANLKVNRVIASVASAFGANARIEDYAGSEAMLDDINLINTAKEVVDEMFGEGKYFHDDFSAASTDMGDVSVLVPAIHAYACGAIGTTHGKDYFIKDPVNACVDSAKFQVELLRKLLSDNASKAKYIIENYKSPFNSIDEYLEHKHSLNMDKQVVKYNEDGTITLDYKG